MLSYRWPGNVRKLEKVAERLAASMSEYQNTAEIYCGDFSKAVPEIFAAAGASRPSIKGQHVTPAWPTLDEALARAGGSRQVAAKMLGVSRTTLWRYLKAEGLG